MSVVAGRRQAKWVLLAAAGLVLLIALGVWQVERLAWKRALIAQVDARLAAAAVPAPGPDRWPDIGGDDAYRRVRVAGRYRSDEDTLVQAVTEAGGGFWVLTPLESLDGWTVLVNRGFVPAGQRTARRPPPQGPVVVTGLLRLNEPGGAFLRSNDPEHDRWYSRDVTVIGQHLGLRQLAPFFIDADRSGEGWPRGGMTVVRFRNHHLLYAATWFGLAALIAVMLWRALRRPAR